MRSVSIISAATLLVLLAILPGSMSFQPTPQCHRRLSSGSRLSSESTSDSDSNFMGATEQLLVQSARQRNQGIRREYGKTVLNDGLDGVRAAVWAIFDVSQVVFGVLGALLSLGLLLNVMGMGYYWDTDSSRFVVDSLQHMHQEQQLQQEAIRLATEAIDSSKII